jgi:hypothetical protein
MAILGVAAVAAATRAPAQAATVYDFVIGCREERQMECLKAIEERIVRLRETENERSFCLPRAFGATMFQSLHIPISLLDYVRLGLSAARFGKAKREVDDVIREILAGIYPCKRS